MKGESIYLPHDISVPTGEVFEIEDNVIWIIDIERDMLYESTIKKIATSNQGKRLTKYRRLVSLYEIININKLPTTTQTSKFEIPFFKGFKTHESSMKRLHTLNMIKPFNQNK